MNETNWSQLSLMMQRISEILGAPGGSLAMRNGDDIIFQHSIGYADRDNQVPMTPQNAFRIGSLSKILTTAGAIALIDDGKLWWNQTLLDIFPALAGMNVKDPRILKITVRHLIQMRISFSPHMDVFDHYAQTIQRVERKTRIDIDYTLNLLRNLELAQNPGAQWTWGLTTFMVLGRVIEQISSDTYEGFIKSRLLEPAGCHDMEIGAVQPEYKLPDEPLYYEPTNRREPAPGYLGIQGDVTPPYRQQVVQLRDSNGGWIARPVDLTKALSAMFNPAAGILSRPAIRLMEMAPAEINSNAPDYFGAGLFVKKDAVHRTFVAPIFHQYDWSAVGGLIGSVNYAIQRRDGLTCVLSFNGAPSMDLAAYYRLMGIVIWNFVNDNLENCWKAIDGFRNVS